MDADLAKQSAEVLIAGLTKAEFVSITCLGGIFVVTLSWWLQRPMVKVQESIDKLLSLAKTEKELEDQIENSVLKHTVACEGKALMPRVLNALDKNTQIIQEHSHATRAMADAAHEMAEAAHTLKQRSI